MGIRTLADLRARDAAGARSRLRAPLGRLAARRAAASKTRRRSRSSARPSRSRPRSTFDVDVADRARAGAPSSPSSAEELCRRLRKRELRGPHDRDQGPPRRLDQRHPLAHRRASRPTTRRWSPRSRSTCCAPTTRRGRCACSASGSPIRRGDDAEPAEPEPTAGLSCRLGLRLRSRSSGWRARCRRRGSRGAPWSPRSGRSRGRRRRGRGRSPAR